MNFLLSLINPLKTITQEIARYQIEKLKADTDEKRLEYDERIKTLESRKQIILQAQSDPVERWIRVLFAVPFIVYIWKLVIWDKVLGLGVTDDLSDNLWYIMMTVLMGYFIDAGIKKVMRR